MSTAEEHNPSAAEDASDSIEIPIGDLVAAIWQRRRWLAKVTGSDLILSVGICIVDSKSIHVHGPIDATRPAVAFKCILLSALTGAGPTASLAGGFMSARTPGGTFIGIMDSQTAQDDIINRFDLRRVYHCKLYFDARKILTGRTVIDEDKKERNHQHQRDGS